MLRKIAKNAYIMGTGTLLSRLLGFVRDILVAGFFGTSNLLEAFLVSFKLPNIFRSIFAEGFADSVATPVLAEQQGDKKRIFEISTRLFSILAVGLLLFTILGIIFAKFLVALIAPGFISETAKFNLTVSFTRATFTYLILIGLSSIAIAVLYSLKKFFIAAVTPIFLNISFIIGILLFSRYFRNYILIACVLVGGLLQVIIPFISLRRSGFILSFDFRAGLRDASIIRMMKLFVPRVWSSLVYHLSVFIDTIFSSLSSVVGQGAVASVYYANRLIQFPFALIALSISRVAIVDLSSYHHKGDLKNFQKLLIFSFQNIAVFIIPLSVLFMFLSDGIVDVVFTRGEFGLNSKQLTSSALFFYSFGLFFFCAIRLFVNAFYALKDTVTPAKIASFSLLVNVVLSAILMFPLKIGGVALGSSLAAVFNFCFLYKELIKRVGKIEWLDTMAQFRKVLALSFVTASIARLLWDYLSLSKYLTASIVALVVLLVFFLGGYITGLRQVVYLLTVVKSRFKRFIFRR
ncbi:MAG: murein biosynthesis integral membrane protein MurJ [Candidatus Omnitrophica bacterium]|nr:murein biosynthesis integral membrane protein MurJ [Candidatus Omnitrophota bacterium]MDD5429230.1 murein biosynthesis integral membrane protein MurJ [Candidatus Omnitrophota bacterium]